MENPSSLQLYFNTVSYTSNTIPSVNDNFKRNQIRLNLAEPIIAPSNYYMTASIVDAQIPVTWASLQKYLLVRSNFRYRNQYLTGQYLGKIPVNAATGYMINYVNLTNYKAPITDRNISYFELSLHNENGTDVYLGEGYDWSCTIQIDFEKIA